MMQDIENKNLSNKSGWVRLSLHPITSNAALLFICDSIKQVGENIEQWRQDYTYNPQSNEFDFRTARDEKIMQTVAEWFRI